MKTKAKRAVQLKLVKGPRLRKPKLPEPKPATAAEMAQRTVTLVITFSGIGNHRRIDNAEVTVDADKRLLQVTKQLIDAPELVAVWKLDGEARRYLDWKCMPSLLKRGVYLLSTELVETV